MSEEIKRGGYRKEICDAISEMLDNPDDCGIYPTTKCYDRLETFIQTQVEAERERCARIASELENEIWDDGQYQVTDSGRKIAEAIRTKPEKE